MTEVEVERMVVRLVGDGSSFQRMTSQAVQSAEAAASRVEAATKRVEGFGHGVQGFARSAITALAGLGVAASLGAAFNTFTEIEKSQVRLRAVIDAGGHSASAVVPDYERFADSISKVTLQSRYAVLAALQRAEVMGHSGEEAKELTKIAISLSGVLGGEASQHIRVAQMIKDGNLDYVKRILGLRGVKDQTELMNRVQGQLNAGWRIATQEANTVGGQITKLGRSLKEVTIEVGRMVAEFIQPAIRWLTEMVQKFRALDPEIKRVVIVVTALTIVLATLGPLVSMISPLLGMFSGIKTIFSVLIGLVGGFTWPLVAGIVAVIAILSVAADQLGGWGALWQIVKDAAVATWDWITSKITEFVVWMTPIAQAVWIVWQETWNLVKVIVGTVWDVVSSVVQAIWEAVSTAWTTIFGNTSINWTAVRDVIRDTVLFVSFYIRNFTAFWKLAFTEAGYEIVKFYNQVEYFFLEVIPTTLDWFVNNWQDIFTDMWNWTSTVFSNLGHNIVEIFKNLPGLISGFTDWSEVWTPLTEGFVRKSKELMPLIPERIEGQLEKSLRESFERQAETLGQSWEDFRAEKVKEMGIKPDSLLPSAAIKKAEEAANMAGATIGQGIGKGVKDEMKKMDATLALSAKGVAAIREYTDVLMFGAKGKSTSSGPSVSSGTAAGVAEVQKSNNLLMDIRDTLKGQAAKQPLEVKDADLGGGDF